jgi:hypothetical protein
MPPHQPVDCETAYTPEKKRWPALMAFGASANTFKTGCGFCLATGLWVLRAPRRGENIQSFSVCPRPLLSADI